MDQRDRLVLAAVDTARPLSNRVLHLTDSHHAAGLQVEDRDKRLRQIEENGSNLNAQETYIDQLRQHAAQIFETDLCYRHMITPYMHDI